MIASGNNGYTAESGYNLVTGLGTPVVSSLVPDLVAYQGTGTSYAGPSVGPLQDVTLVDPTSATGGPIDVFSVFDALTVGSPGVGQDRTEVRGSAELSTVSLESPATGSTNQALMALDSVINEWTPGGGTAIKRLVPFTGKRTALPGTGKVKVLPAMNLTNDHRGCRSGDSGHARARTHDRKQEQAARAVLAELHRSLAEGLRGGCDSMPQAILQCMILCYSVC